MPEFVENFPDAHRRRVFREWLIAALLVLCAAALLSVLWVDRIDPDVEAVALCCAILLLAYPVPLTIRFAWGSTFTARVAVVFERRPEGEKHLLPPLYAPSRAQQRSGRALARSWRQLSGLASARNIPSLDEFGVSRVHDASRPTFDVRRGVAVVEGLVQALDKNVDVVDEEILSDLRDLERQLKEKPSGVERFSLVMV